MPPLTQPPATAATGTSNPFQTLGIESYSDIVSQIDPAEIEAGHVVVLSIDDNLQEAFEASPEGTVFVLKAGDYYGQSRLDPKNGQVIVAEEGAVLKGAQLYDDWSLDSESGTYVLSGVHAPNHDYVDGSWVDYGTGELTEFANEWGSANANYAEDLFIDGQLFLRVPEPENPAELSDGTFYVDANGNFHINSQSNPEGLKTEVSKHEFCIKSDADNVSLINLTVTQFASQAHRGAIEVRDGTGWELIDVTSTFNHGAGAWVGEGARVQGGSFSNNGQIGLLASKGETITIEDVQLSENNFAGFRQDWEAGGIKVAGREGTDISLSGAYVQGNHGKGIWVDVYPTGVEITGNHTIQNDRDGIYNELSYKTQITGNVSAGNGAAVDYWTLGAQINHYLSSGSVAKGNLAYAPTDEVGIVHQLTKSRFDDDTNNDGSVFTGNTVIHAAGNGVSGIGNKSGQSLSDTAKMDGNQYILAQGDESGFFQYEDSALSGSVADRTDNPLKYGYETTGQISRVASTEEYMRSIGLDLYLQSELPDVLQGTGFSETVEGTQSSDILMGAGGNDVLSGGAGSDILMGGAGDDLLIGGAGIDFIHAGTGRDTIVIRSAAETGDAIQSFDPARHFLDVSSLLAELGKSHEDLYLKSNGVNANHKLLMLDLGSEDIVVAQFLHAETDELKLSDIHFLTDDGEITVENRPQFHIFLVDADSDHLLMEIGDGSVIPAEYHGLNLTVLVTNVGDPVGSVRIEIPGIANQVETKIPYALFGDTEDDLHGGFTLPENGTLEIKITAYEGPFGSRGTLFEAGYHADITPETVEPEVPVLRLQLIDADTNEVIAVLDGSGPIPFEEIVGRNVTIAVWNDSDVTIGSVRLAVPGVYQKIENVEPYALFGDEKFGDGGIDFIGHADGYKLADGDHEIVLTVYEQSGGRGSEIFSQTIEFEVAAPVVPDPDPAPDEPLEPDLKFYLYDADTEERLQELKNGEDLIKADFLGRNLTILVEDVGGSAKSIAMQFGGSGDWRVENNAPYALFGDNGSLADLYGGFQIESSTSKLRFKSVAYDGRDASGNKLESIYLDLKVRDPRIAVELYDMTSGNFIQTLGNATSVISYEQIRDSDFTIYVRNDGFSEIGSVKFTFKDLITGETITKIENMAPFALFGDGGTLETMKGGGRLDPGKYHLTVEVYAGRNGGGDLLKQQATSISVISEATAPLRTDNDHLTGSVQDDTLFGQAGNDAISGEAGDDTLHGAAGDDLLSGGSGDDTLHGGAGDDILQGGSGSDDLSGGSGDDQLSGGSGNDMLQGGDGDDVLDGGSGVNLLSGGEGADVFVASNGNSTVVDFDDLDTVGVQVGTEIRSLKADTVDFAGGGQASVYASTDGEGVTVHIDSNGDGIEDGTLVLDGVDELTQDNFVFIDEEPETPVLTAEQEAFLQNAEAGIVSGGYTLETVKALADQHKADFEARGIESKIVTINVGDEIQDVINAAKKEHPNGGLVFVLSAGIHRDLNHANEDKAAISLPDDCVFIGEPGAIISGAVKLKSGWTKDGTGHWKIEDVPLADTGWLDPETYKQNKHKYTNKMAGYTEDLFIDNELYHRVEHLEDLQGRKNAFFQNGSTIFISDMNDDPNADGKISEFGQRGSAFNYQSSNVVIQNVIVEKFANSDHHGAIQINQTSNWSLIDVTAQYNHGAGAALGENTLVDGGSYSNNGQLGVLVQKSNSTVQHAVIEGNNYAGYSTGYEAGGLKTAYGVHNAFLHNYIASNLGRGMWSDVDSSYDLFYGNYSFHNAQDGFDFEISSNHLVERNVAIGNGHDVSTGDAKAGYGSQIVIRNSDNIEASFNLCVVLEGFGNGMNIINTRRSLFGEDRYTDDTVVQNNSILHLGNNGRNGFTTDHVTSRDFASYMEGNQFIFSDATEGRFFIYTVNYGPGSTSRYSHGTSDPAKYGYEDGDLDGTSVPRGQQTGVDDIAAYAAERGLLGAINLNDPDTLRINGTSLSEMIKGTDGIDIITPGNGDDFIDAGGGSDMVLGSKGNDTIIGGAGVDFLDGGEGADRFIFRDVSELGDLFFSFEAGVDKVDLRLLLQNINEDLDTDYSAHDVFILSADSHDGDAADSNGHEQFVTLNMGDGHLVIGRFLHTIGDLSAGDFIF